LAKGKKAYIAKKQKTRMNIETMERERWEEQHAKVAKLTLRFK